QIEAKIEKELMKKLMGSKEFTLADGKTYDYFFSLGSAKRFNKKHGSIIKAFEQIGKDGDIDVDMLIDLLYEGIKTCHKDVTVEYIEDVVNFFEIEPIMKELFGGFGDKKKKEKE